MVRPSVGRFVTVADCVSPVFPEKRSAPAEMLPTNSVKFVTQEPASHWNVTVVDKAVPGVGLVILAAAGEEQFWACASPPTAKPSAAMRAVLSLNLVTTDL